MLLAKGRKFLQNNSKTKGYIGKYPKDKNKILFLNFKKHNLYNTKKKIPSMKVIGVLHSTLYINQNVVI